MRILGTLKVSASDTTHCGGEAGGGAAIATGAAVATHVRAHVQQGPVLPAAQTPGQGLVAVVKPRQCGGGNQVGKDGGQDLGQISPFTSTNHFTESKYLLGSNFNLLGMTRSWRESGRPTDVT